jgi:uncharacterized protein (TIGR00251 family)
LHKAGSGYLRGQNKSLTTEDTEEHRERGKPLDQWPLRNGSDMIPVHETPLGVTFAIRVHPRARKNAITGELGDALKVALTAPPVDGKANEACIEFFANLLKVPRSSVTIAAGQNTRNKVIRVTELSAQQIQDRLTR